jgi:hypothetical protein
MRAFHGDTAADLWASVGNHGMLPTAWGSGINWAFQSGDLAFAAAWLRHLVAHHRRFAVEAHASTLAVMVAIPAFRSGMPDDAAMLLGVAEGPLANEADAVLTFNRAGHDTAVRAALDDPSFDAPRARGRTLTYDEVLDFADEVLAQIAERDD